MAIGVERPSAGDEKRSPHVADTALPIDCIGQHMGGGVIGISDQQRCFSRLPPDKDSESTCHVCVMGVSPRDDQSLREVSMTFGNVSSIERNAKVGQSDLRSV